MTGNRAMGVLDPTATADSRRHGVDDPDLCGTAMEGQDRYSRPKGDRSRATRTWTMWVEGAAENSTTERMSAEGCDVQRGWLAGFGLEGSEVGSKDGSESRRWGVPFKLMYASLCVICLGTV
jgi:hypothetical protein